MHLGITVSLSMATPRHTTGPVTWWYGSEMAMSHNTINFPNGCVIGIQTGNIGKDRLVRPVGKSGNDYDVLSVPHSR